MRHCSSSWKPCLFLFPPKCRQILLTQAGEAVALLVQLTVPRTPAGPAVGGHSGEAFMFLVWHPGRTVSCVVAFPWQAKPRQAREVSYKHSPMPEPVNDPFPPCAGMYLQHSSSL